MTADTPEEPDADEIELDGEGPFRLPVCTDLRGLAVGEALAFISFETESGQRVDVPVPVGMLVELGEAVAEALRLATTDRDGLMVQ